MNGSSFWTALFCGIILGVLLSTSGFALLSSQAASNQRRHRRRCVAEEPEVRIEEESRRRAADAAAAAAGAAANGDDAATHIFTLLLVTDLDLDSRQHATFEWHAYLKRVELLRFANDTYGVRGGGARDIVLRTSLARANRSLELSELAYYDRKLLAFCDYSGIVYRIDAETGEIWPRLAIADGDGKRAKPFKSEWATTKDGVLYVGSMGKEWVDEDTGRVVHRHPQWVKTIDACGRVRNVNWRARYEALRRAANVSYLLHEAVLWHPVRRQWLFVPRRASHDAYHSKTDERRGTNLIFYVTPNDDDDDDSDGDDGNWRALEDANDDDGPLAAGDNDVVEVSRLPAPLDVLWGASSARLVPGSRGRHLLALQAYEVDGRTASRLALFDLSAPDGGGMLTRDWLPVSTHHKYEGMTFVP